MVTFRVVFLVLVFLVFLAPTSCTRAVLVTTSAQTRTDDFETNMWISQFNLFHVSFLDQIDSLSS